MPTQEFLEEMLDQAKQYLPKWLYISLMSAARSKAGGRIRASRARQQKESFIEKPFPNEHAARQTDPKLYDEFRRVHEDWLPSGVDVVYGIKTENGKRVSEIQTFRFDRKKFTPEQAKQWLKNNDFKTQIEEASNKSKAMISFLVSELSEIEKARNEALVGEAGRIFKEKYLDPLGIDKDDIHITINKDEIPDINPHIVIALGRIAKQELGDWADFSLPHPEALKRHGDSGEVSRKLKSIHRVLFDKYDKELYFKDSTQWLNKEPIVEYKANPKAVHSKIIKSAPVKRIVYGVVSDPYGKTGPEFDAHNDWISPAEIEKMAHDYMKESRVVGLQHIAKANAQVVESWIEQYPTRDEYLKALNGEPHKVIRRQFGDDVLHSGSWVMGVELGEKEWNLYEKGSLNGFSIGARGTRSPISKKEMPEVTFVDIKESGQND